MKCHNCGAENPDNSEMCCECGDDFNTQMAPLPVGMDDELYCVLMEAEMARNSLQDFPSFYDYLYNHHDVLADPRAQLSLRKLILEC